VFDADLRLDLDLRALFIRSQRLQLMSEPALLLLHRELLTPYRKLGVVLLSP
jgi:hypothetical protein